MDTHPVKIDLVTQRPDGAFVMVLVEQGPWEESDILQQLRRLQDRLYDCVEIAIDGHLSQRFPDAVGKPIWIRLDCYETPDEPVRSFFERFEKWLREGDEYRDGVMSLDSLHLEYNWRRLGEAG
jgi:hypothetical protein